MFWTLFNLWTLWNIASLFWLLAWPFILLAAFVLALAIIFGREFIVLGPRRWWKEVKDGWNRGVQRAKDRQQA